MRKQMHLAESMLNRLMNFADDLDELDAITPDVALQSAQLDDALATPTEPVSAPGIEPALIAKGLNL